LSIWLIYVLPFATYKRLIFPSIFSIQDSVEIVHTITIGFNGAGRILDPLLKMVFSEDFEKALNEHARIEFHKLAELLSCSAERF